MKQRARMMELSKAGSTSLVMKGMASLCANPRYTHTALSVCMYTCSVACAAFFVGLPFLGMSIRLWLREWEIPGAGAGAGGRKDWRSSLWKLPCTPGLLGAWGEAHVIAILDLAILSLFFGLRSRYLKMEQILLPQRHPILLPQRSLKEVTATQLSCLPISRSP